ncbi:MAG: hypothetical protein JO153_19640, partial [Solirubrobacterales bacterium]|nr:hypothetical protein [Solirubrobacterales bacterium]
RRVHDARVSDPSRGGPLDLRARLPPVLPALTPSPSRSANHVSPDATKLSVRGFHTTGGTTALEARAVGCSLINYGRGIAHVRAHARALRDMDLAEWAPERSALNAAIARALIQGRRPPMNVEALPDAAALVAALAYGVDSSGARSPNKTPS